MKEGEGSEGAFQLDVVVAASGFGKKEMKSLEEASKEFYELILKPF